MFTGIIESVSRIRTIEAVGGDARLTVGCGALPMDQVKPGDSIAVSGVCLTVVELDARGFSADVSQETLKRSALGRREVGDAVNLERAMRADARFDGHLVAGHVDAVGEVLAIESEGRSQRWRFSLPAAMARYVAEKGSVAVDGVSLTVNAVDGDGFEVNLVPHTLAHTAFSEACLGTPVNLEADLVARYLERLAGFARN